MTPLILENETLHLEWNPANGALTKLYAVQTDWKLLDRAHLGLSFQLLLPLPGRRNNLVLGEQQTLTSATMQENQITFVWEEIRSQYGGQHPIKVVMEVCLERKQVIFTVTIENRSEYVVENVYAPFLGDVQRPPRAEWFKTFIYTYASAQEMSIFPTYQNTRGYFGIDSPMQMSAWGAGVGAPMSPFVLLREARQGLYVGVNSASSELVAWYSELRPGYANSLVATPTAINILNGETPAGSKIGEHDVIVRFAAIHVPYIAPGETRTLTPVALEAYQGDWQQGVDIYRDWRKSWMHTPAIPKWADEPHAWQQIHINSPEDELRLRFSDLPRIGEDCARHGVRAIQLVGWNDGGQDQGNPLHDPDPRLGSAAELKDAIAQIQALGVKVILFTKFTWADRATEWFRNDLQRQAIKDPYGDYYHYSGYQYQTATQLLDINTKRLIPMCFLSEDYLKICEQEFIKVLELGADGMLFDESLHHSPALLCFDESHGHRSGAMVYANDRELIRRLKVLADGYNKDYLFSGEACYDWEFEQYHLSYHRSEQASHIPLSRYMLPHAALMTAVTGFNDRNMLNQCLLYRYIISYEPFNFKGRLDDYPLTLAYGKQMDALRLELRDFFWDGEFQGTSLAQVMTTDGAAHTPYSVFQNRNTGQSAVVVANYENRPITISVQLESGQPLSRYRLVDDPIWHSIHQEIALPGYSAAVVLP